MSERASISTFRSPSRITQSLAFPYPSRHDTRNKHVHYQGLVGLQDFLYGLARIEGSVGRGSALSDQGALNERSSAHIASLLWLYAAKNSALLIESFIYTVCIPFSQPRHFSLVPSRLPWSLNGKKERFVVVCEYPYTD
jgi:hypothetical protein